MPKLHYVLRGIKKKEAARLSGGRERLPITLSLLARMKAVWERNTVLTDKEMLWAASCLGFFAFLRVGEMTVPSDSGYDPSVHLSVGEVAIDHPRVPSMARICIKQSKTDPFRKGISLFVGRTASALCPVAALLGYLQVRGTDRAHFFVTGMAGH